MDDEERLASCQKEIFRLRRVVHCMEADQQQYQKKLLEEIAKGTDETAGLRKALDIWMQIMEENE